MSLSGAEKYRDMKEKAMSRDKIKRYQTKKVCQVI
jgi:hypothetical protein